MSQMQDKAKAALKHAMDKMAWYYDRQRSPAPAYKVGTKVWLNAQNYMTTCLTKKLDHKWLSPFEIKKVISSTTVVGGITVCYGTCLQSLVLRARVYHCDCIILAFHSTYETWQGYWWSVMLDIGGVPGVK